MNENESTSSLGTAVSAAQNFISEVNAIQTHLLVENTRLTMELLWVKAQLLIAKTRLSMMEKKLSDCEASKAASINPVGIEDTAAAMNGKPIPIRD